MNRGQLITYKSRYTVQTNPTTSDLREVFAAADPESAMRIDERSAEHWRPKYPSVAKLIEENIEDCLAILALPSSHRQRLRTTYGLEWVYEEKNAGLG